MGIVKDVESETDEVVAAAAVVAVAAVVDADAVVAEHIAVIQCDELLQEEIDEVEEAAGPNSEMAADNHKESLEMHQQRHMQRPRTDVASAPGASVEACYGLETVRGYSADVAAENRLEKSPSEKADAGATIGDSSSSCHLTPEVEIEATG